MQPMRAFHGKNSTAASNGLSRLGQNIKGEATREPMKKHGHLAAGLRAGVSALALASLASLQADSAQTADTQQAEQVVVTGSRVIANGNDMPTPVTIVSTEDLTATTPATVMD